MIPSTTMRVPEQTSDAVNAEIRRETDRTIAHYAAAGPEAIERRLEELDREWDIERTLEANAASVSLIGLGLGRFVDRRFYLLPLAVAGFLLQHAVQGWCPPMPVFRRLGFRTAAEIEEERYALKALRGDFLPVADREAQMGGKIEAAIRAVRDLPIRSLLIPAGRGAPSAES